MLLHCSSYRNFLFLSLKSKVRSFVKLRRESARDCAMLAKFTALLKPDSSGRDKRKKEIKHGPRTENCSSATCQPRDSSLSEGWGGGGRNLPKRSVDQRRFYSPPKLGRAYVAINQAEP